MRASLTAGRPEARILRQIFAEEVKLDDGFPPAGDTMRDRQSNPLYEICGRTFEGDVKVAT